MAHDKAARWKKNVHKCSNRFGENMRLFAELPQHTKEIPDVEMPLYFKREMPMAWQDKLVVADVTHESPQRDDTLFSRIENKRDYTKVIFTRKPWISR